MENKTSPNQARFLAEKDGAACRIETRGGTVYWVSSSDAEGLRWVIREQLQSADTNTQVVQRGVGTRIEVDLGDKFRARLKGAVTPGKPCVLEMPRDGAQIVTDVVVAVEVGGLPEMIFR